jgi:hypothetical protein
MRHERMLGKHVWYLVSTAVNVGEPLFQLSWVANFLYRVLQDAKGIFFFEMCGLRFERATWTLPRWADTVKRLAHS